MAADLLFQVFPSSGLPIYRQLTDQVRRHIASGRLEPGDYLPSVRQVAQALDINAMTVSKAYSLLERDGVVELDRGQGMRVVDRVNGQGTLSQRKERLAPLVEQMLAEAHQLALSSRQVQSLLAQIIKERDQK
ncbi:MAG: GntR family transcriptional regulator [Pirellulales bacterium]